VKLHIKAAKYAIMQALSRKRTMKNKKQAQFLIITLLDL